MQKRNARKLGIRRMVSGIQRFNRPALALLADGGPTGRKTKDQEETLGEILARVGFSKEVVENYVVPMGTSIWSSSVEGMHRIPARFFIEFLENHRMLQIRDRPQQRLVHEGSARYVKALTQGFSDSIRLSTSVLVVRREPQAGLEGANDIELTQAGDEA